MDDAEIESDGVMEEPGFPVLLLSPKNMVLFTTKNDFYCLFLQSYIEAGAVMFGGEEEGGEEGEGEGGGGMRSILFDRDEVRRGKIYRVLARKWRENDDSVFD